MKFIIMFLKIEISKNRVKIEECYFFLYKKKKKNSNIYFRGRNRDELI